MIHAAMDNLVLTPWEKKGKMTTRKMKKEAVPVPFLYSSQTFLGKAVSIK